MDLTATVEYPYVDAERAALALRAELRRQATDEGVLPDWSALAVDGPREEAGARGRRWFVWKGSVGSGR